MRMSPPEYIIDLASSASPLVDYADCEYSSAANYPPNTNFFILGL